MTLERGVVEFQDQPYGRQGAGRILNVLADEDVLDEKGGSTHPPLTRCATATARFASRQANRGRAARGTP